MTSLHECGDTDLCTSMMLQSTMFQCSVSKYCNSCSRQSLTSTATDAVQTEMITKQNHRFARGLSSPEAANIASHRQDSTAKESALCPKSLRGIV